MEIRFTFDDAQMELLQERTRTARAVDVVRDGITLLGWATRQAVAGREIGSYEADGSDVRGYELDCIARARAGVQ